MIFENYRITIWYSNEYNMLTFDSCSSRFEIDLIAVLDKCYINVEIVPWLLNYCNLSTLLQCYVVIVREIKPTVVDFVVRKDEGYEII